MESFIQSAGELENEARTSVGHQLENKKGKYEGQIKKKSALLFEKRNKWTDTQIAEREMEIESVKEKLASTKTMLDQIALGEEGKKLKGIIRRKKDQLVVIKRLQKRKAGAGRKRLIDEADERYLERCIAEKATAHGRRHDTVWYLDHRVKGRHFLRLLNHYHEQRNLPLIKSFSAIYNRSRPKNMRSKQAKNHIGMGLFCCKKSPKSEETSTILSHFCLSTKKVTSSKLCKEDGGAVLHRSFDDKAYLCPGTKTGMDSTRHQKVITTTNEDLARKFKKYDFPTSMLSCTPGVFLYMTKSLQENEGNERLVIDEQDVVVAVKSKYFVGSSGSVWASHAMENRHREAVLHEVPNDISITSVPLSLRNSICKIKDNCANFLLQNMKDDVLLVVCGKSHFRTYELKKAGALLRAFQEVAEVMENLVVTEECIDFSKVDELLKIGIMVVNELLVKWEDLKNTGEMVMQNMDEVAKICEKIKKETSSMMLSSYPAFQLLHIEVESNDIYLVSVVRVLSKICLLS